MKLPFLFLMLTVCFQLVAQKKNEAFRLNIKKTNLQVIIDGVGDEKAWENTDIANNYFIEPFEGRIGHLPSSSLIGSINNGIEQIVKPRLEHSIF